MSKTDNECREAAPASSSCRSELSNEINNIYDSNANSITSDYNYSTSRSFDSEFNDIDYVDADKSSHKLRINAKDKDKNSESNVIKQEVFDKEKHANHAFYNKWIQEPREQINCLQTTQTLTPAYNSKLTNDKSFEKISKEQQQEEITLSKTCVREEQELSQTSSSLLSSSERPRTYASFSDLSSSHSAESLRNYWKSISDTENASYSSCGCATSCSCRSSSHKESNVSSSSTGKGTHLNVSTHTSCKTSESNREMRSKCSSINENYQTYADNTAYTKLAQELGLPPLIHLRQRRQQYRREGNTICVHYNYSDNLDSQCINVQESQEQYVVHTADDLVAMTATIAHMTDTEKNKTLHNNNMTENKYCAGQELHEKNDNSKLVDKIVNSDGKLHMESKCNTVTIKESSIQTECELTAETNDTKATIIETTTTTTTTPMTNAVNITKEMLITKKEMADLLLELFMQLSQDK